jgi:hypothetical protein
MNILDYVRIETSTVQDGNMSYVYGDKEEVKTNRLRFFNKLNLKYNNTYLLETNLKELNIVKVVNDTPQELTLLEKTDSVITNNKDIILGLLTADCLQIVLFDIQTKTLALIHAGFRWQDAGIIDKTFEIMQESYGTSANNLLVHLGNCIAETKYRWDKNIFKITNPNSFIRKTIIKDDNNERPYIIDIREAARRNLLDLGIPESNILDNNIDCYTNKNLFSHRRSAEMNEQEGRHLTVVKMK